MIELKNKTLMVIVNVLLFPWLITQWLLGLIGLVIFHNCTWYINEEAKVRVIRVNKGNIFGNACFSCGPIIFTTPKCNDNTLRHETGHSVQSLIFGPLFHIFISIPSIILFWTRKIKNKDAKWYHAHWPENNADRLGHVDVSKYGL